MRTESLLRLRIFPSPVVAVAAARAEHLLGPVGPAGYWQREAMEHSVGSQHSVSALSSSLLMTPNRMLLLVSDVRQWKLWKAGGVPCLVFVTRIRAGLYIAPTGISTWARSSVCWFLPSTHQHLEMPLRD